jgi:methionyl-tRNA formyltransferase
MTPPPVALSAKNAGVQLLQTQSLRDDASVSQLKDAAPDVLVVVAYGEILTLRVLNLAPHGALNVHPSLLPKYRGAAPIPAAIANGDSITGVSFMKMVRRLDAGPVIATFPVAVPADATTGSLSAMLADLAATRLPDVMAGWIEGSISAIDQDESVASYTREWTKADGMIDWNQPAQAIERLVRAALPWPVAWTSHDGLRIQIRKCLVFGGQGSPDTTPGQIEQLEESVIVRTGEGWLKLLTVQPESKRPVDASDWWRGVGQTSAMFES